MVIGSGPTSAKLIRAIDAPTKKTAIEVITDFTIIFDLLILLNIDRFLFAN